MRLQLKKIFQNSWLLPSKNHSQKKYLKEALMFYRNVLPEMGEELDNLIDVNKERTIYFFSHNKIRDICFYSDFYKQPFVFVQDQKNIMTRWALIHEMGHQYDMLKGKKLTSLSELTPTFAEMLSNDYFSITKNRQLETEILKKYRLKSTISLIASLHQQMKGLLYLENQGNLIFDLEEIEEMFIELNISQKQKNDFLLNPFRGFNYSLSYLLALKYQALFYNNDLMIKEKLELIRSNKYKLYDYMNKYQKNMNGYIDINLELQDIDYYIENSFEKVLK